jgi:uncharacterized protein YbbK (DUF523 family)
MTDQIYLKQLRQPTVNDPLRVMISACLWGVCCAWNGTDNGNYSEIKRLMSYPNVSFTRFCPEDFAYGTPRELSDIHGGNGFDVLDGKAKVITESGIDWTDGMIRASEKMLELAILNRIELAILLDISAACGSQVIYSGSRLNAEKVYHIRAGVCAAQLIRNGIKVISQRDFASIELLFSKMDPAHVVDETKLDHHQTKWYKEYFNI